MKMTNKDFYGYLHSDPLNVLPSLKTTMKNDLVRKLYELMYERKDDEELYSKLTSIVNRLKML